MTFKKANSKNDILIGLVVVFLVGTFVYFKHTERVGNTAALADRDTAVHESPADMTASTTTELSLAEVGEHNGENSCWTIINSNVYDLTNWIAQHPGGSSAILQLCGEDGSTIFNRQHSGSSGPESQLKSFYIGTLTQ